MNGVNLMKAKLKWFLIIENDNVTDQGIEAKDIHEARKILLEQQGLDIKPYSTKLAKQAT